MNLEEFKKIIKERECEAWNSFCLAEPRSREEKEMLARKIAFGEVLELLESTEEPKKVVIPQFVVRQGGSEVWYLQGFRNSLDGDIVKRWCSYEGCIKFTDKSKAEAVATLVEGSVEEV